MGYRDYVTAPGGIYQVDSLDEHNKRTLNDVTPEEWDKASKTQVGGNHYKHLVIQPAYFCHVNNIPYLEATAIKYLCRWRKKNGIEDLRKAKHFIDLLIEFENADTKGT